jgi:hypothetical protein
VFICNDVFSSVWVQILDRRQQLLQLVLIPIEHFVPREDGLLLSGASAARENGYQCNGLAAGQPSPISLPTYQVICVAKSETWYISKANKTKSK